jgi:hypothetical protein
MTLLTWCAVAGECESLLYEKPSVHPLLLHWLRMMDPLTLVLTGVGVVILFLESTAYLTNKKARGPSVEFERLPAR